MATTTQTHLELAKGKQSAASTSSNAVPLPRGAKMRMQMGQQLDRSMEREKLRKSLENARS